MAAQGYFPQKMQAAIWLFCTRIQNGTLGRTKLAKLLYFLDFDHFEQYGEPVTGADYIHQKRGPYPKQMKQEICHLRGGDAIKEEHEQVGPYLRYTYYPGEATLDLGLFSQTELLTLIEVAQKWERQTATELVAASHGEVPWIATEYLEVIPYAYADYRHKFEIIGDEEEEETAPLATVDD